MIAASKSSSLTPMMMFSSEDPWSIILTLTFACASAAKILPAGKSSEKELMLVLSKYQDMIRTAVEELAPHKICAYIYDLANSFNKFYHDTKILSEENEEKKAGYISLISAGRYADAIRLIRKDNPFPTACAMVCEHPCENRCRRSI